MRRLTLAATLALLGLPASAHAGFFPGDAIDGPSPDIVRVGDVDIARDGNGALVYVKRADGVEHIFASRTAEGVFQAPERVDNGLGPASSQPVVGAASDGRIAIAYVNNGSLYTVVKAKDAPGFSAPLAVAEGGVSNPSIDMSINGATYVSYTQNGDVKAARAERDQPAFTVLPSALDIAAAQPAGTGAGRSRVVTSADGTAVVVWGERGSDGRNHVFARRLFEQRLSQVPQDLTLAEFEGQPAQDADSPELDVEDDSSYAQVVFRQQTSAGSRVVMRRLLGSTFDPPIGLDQGAGAVGGRVDLTGRGEGIFAVQKSGVEVLAGTLFNNASNLHQRFDTGNAIEPVPIPSVGENENGVVTWLHGTSAADATVRGRFVDTIERPTVEPEATISNPAFGPVVTGAGYDAAATRSADVNVVFVQGGDADRRLVVGTYDRAPSRVTLFNTENPRGHPKLRWSPSVNLLGPTTYRVILDGRQIAETTTPELTTNRTLLREGNHRWQVVAVDRRGQQSVSRTRRLRVENTPPRLRASIRRSGRTVSVRARATDPRSRLRTGMDRILVSWGDGSTSRVRGGGASHRFSRSGTFTVRVRARDRAGNEDVVTRQVRIG